MAFAVFELLLNTSSGVLAGASMRTGQCHALIPARAGSREQVVMGFSEILAAN
jgi:hypothetical protein